jgi:hypothetical protein
MKKILSLALPATTGATFESVLEYVLCPLASH